MNLDVENHSNVLKLELKDTPIDNRNYEGEKVSKDSEQFS
jgi:hypothetical protein